MSEIEFGEHPNTCGPAVALRGNGLRQASGIEMTSDDQSANTKRPSPRMTVTMRSVGPPDLQLLVGFLASYMAKEASGAVATEHALKELTKATGCTMSHDG